LKITKITTDTLSVPLKKPFKTALRTVHAIENVLVRVETDEGLIGLGEAAPTALITGDTFPAIEGAIRGPIAAALTGHPLDDFDGLMAALHGALLKNTSAKAAVDMALYDLRAQSLGVPLYKLLGGNKQRLDTDITISLNSTETMVSDSLEAVEAGFRILKIKVGRDPANDPQTIAEIRQAVGADVILRVDPNQGWTPKEAVRAILLIEDKGCDVELVEQPVHALDINGLRFVTERVQTPILADECMFSPQDAEEIIRTRAADYLNIKLMKTGGIYQALKICALAETHRVQCMMGCMLEAKISVGAAAHLAAGKGIIRMVDLDGPALCAADPFTGGPVFNGPGITMTGDPGLGVRLQAFE